MEDTAAKRRKTLGISKKNKVEDNKSSTPGKNNPRKKKGDLQQPGSSIAQDRRNQSHKVEEEDTYEIEEIDEKDYPPTPAVNKKNLPSPKKVTKKRRQTDSYYSGPPMIQGKLKIVRTPITKPPPSSPSPPPPKEPQQNDQPPAT